MKQRNIKRTVLKITMIVFLLCLPVLLITLYYTSSKISWNPYLDEYKNDYIHRFDYELTVRGWFTTRINRYSRIWFLPSQKDKMRNAICDIMYGNGATYYGNVIEYRYIAQEAE